MPPPQCPECGRFLATAFVEQIATEPAPCPGCGAELSFEPEDDTPAAAASSGDEDTAGDDVADEGAAPEGDSAAPEDEDVDAPHPAPADAPGDVEPDPGTAVRPPDRPADRDPLAGWDETVTLPAPDDELDPAVLAAGVGIGALLGILLGGRDHRALGALLGALLGAVVSRLRG